MKKNGELVQRIDGTEVIVATYDRNTGHLEFETKEYSIKLYNQVCAKIGSINKGTSPSGLTIKSMGVKGEVRDLSKNAPPKPRFNPSLGDTDPPRVRWYFKYNPSEAFIRYQVYLDPNGQPIRKRVKRRNVELVDDRSGEDGFSDETRQIGKNRWEKGPIGERVSVEFLDDQIIARRATCMTFTPNEVVGGFDSGNEEEDPIMASNEEGGDA